MATLFEIKNNKVIPKPEILLIEPFKSIWERDKSKNKSKAINELSYIEFMSSFQRSNPYRNYSEAEKEKRIIKDVFGEISKWKPDKKVKEGVKKLQEFYQNMSKAYKYYVAAKIAADRTLEFLKSIDYNKLNPKTGNPMYKPRDTTSALKDIEALMDRLEKLEKRMFEELDRTERVRSDKKISPFSIPKKNFDNK